MEWVMRMVTETNRYASQVINAGGHRRASRIHQWTETCVAEMMGFLAVVMNMGLVRLPSINDYWSNEDNIGQPWFKRMFSRNRFQLLLKFFHLVDNTTMPAHGQRGYNPAGKFEPFLDHLNSKFRAAFTPHQHVSVDESMIGTKGRSGLKQYLPNKHHARFGVKLWALCCSVTGYCLSMLVYKAKRYSPPASGNGLGFDVVVQLMTLSNLLNRAYHVVTDNFFSSLALAKFLYRRGTFFTGTIRRTRRGLPQAVAKGSPGVGEVVNRRSVCQTILALLWRQKQGRQPVAVISTAASSGTVREKGQDIPLAITTYNKYMGGVDLHDAMLYCYLDERKTLKVWKKCAFNLIGRTLLNAYILYKCNTGHTPVLSRHQFVCSVIRSLSQEWLRAKGAGGDGRIAPLHVLQERQAAGVQRLPGKLERICVACKVLNLRRRSRTICSVCGKGLHLQCLENHQCEQ